MANVNKVLFLIFTGGLVLAGLLFFSLSVFFDMKYYYESSQNCDNLEGCDKVKCELNISAAVHKEKLRAEYQNCLLEKLVEQTKETKETEATETSISITETSISIMFFKSLEEVNIGYDNIWTNLSGKSMLPLIRTGDIILTKNYEHDEEMKVGEVILYKSGDRLIAHVITKELGSSIITQGINNEHADFIVTPKAKVLGKVIGVIRK